MSAIQRIDRLGSRHHSSYLILARGAFWLGITRIALWILPFKQVTNLLRINLESRPQLGEEDLNQEDQIVWAIDALSQRLPMFRNCLNRALAAQCLLRNSGSTGRLLIGVARGAEGEFKAHAWVERNGKIVIGRLPDLATYTPLKSVQRKAI
jgi:hypothetical protein